MIKCERCKKELADTFILMGISITTITIDRRGVVSKPNCAKEQRESIFCKGCYDNIIKKVDGVEKEEAKW